MKEMVARAQSALDDAGMSRKALAEAVGMSPSTVNEFFNGEAKQTPGWICRMARVLEVSCDWIEEGIGPRERPAGVSRELLRDVLAAVDGDPDLRRWPPDNRVDLILGICDVEMPENPNEAPRPINLLRYRRMIDRFAPA